MSYIVKRAESGAYVDTLSELDAKDRARSIFENTGERCILQHEVSGEEILWPIPPEEEKAEAKPKKKK